MHFASSGPFFFSGDSHLYQHIKVPAQGEKIIVNADMSLTVPDQPVIPFIEGDGTGMDITPVMLKVVDAAVAKAYGGKRKIHWMEVYAGEKSTKVYGPDVWLPPETLAALKEYVVSIKGPLTTPAGELGIRSPSVLEQVTRQFCQGRSLAFFQGHMSVNGLTDHAVNQIAEAIGK